MFSQERQQLSEPQPLLKVGLVLVDQFYLSSMAGILDPMHVANAHIRNQQGPQAPQFECRTVSQTVEPVTAAGGIKVQADTDISRDNNFDVLFLSAFPYRGVSAFESMADQHRPLLDWVVEQWRKGVVITSACTGVFLLAETQLLDGRLATTTWWLERPFRLRFPKVRLDSRALVAEEDRIMSAGAMTANQNLAVRLIERYSSSELAVQCAKTMLIDTNENAQTPYQNLMLSDPSGDPVVAKAQYWLQSHLAGSIDQTVLAEKVGVSQRTLIRRFKNELGITPLTYLQNARIETAKKLLENTNMPLTEVIEQVGYADLSSFSRLFKQRIGITPAAYRAKFKSN